MIEKSPRWTHEPLTRLARHYPCAHCGADTGTTVSAHSNWSDAGKGMALKAHDCHIAFLCGRCHGWLDQGRGRDPTNVFIATREDKREVWTRAHLKTFYWLWRDGRLRVAN